MLLSNADSVPDTIPTGYRNEATSQKLFIHGRYKLRVRFHESHWIIPVSIPTCTMQQWLPWYCITICMSTMTPMIAQKNLVCRLNSISHGVTIVLSLSVGTDCGKMKMKFQVPWLALLVNCLYLYKKKSNSTTAIFCTGISERFSTVSSKFSEYGEYDLW